MKTTNIPQARIMAASAEMKTTGAPLIVFEHGGAWFELRRGRVRAHRICGARKKTGERCRSKKLYRGEKCKFHGGLSTGPKTPEGKARAIAALRRIKSVISKNNYFLI